MKYLILSSLSFLSLLEARPPKDLILMPPAREKGMRVIRNKNITFTNEQPEEIQKNQIATTFSVKGRSRPDRSGRVLSLITAKSIVTPLKRSEDKKWIAVIVKKSGIRVWVPKASLPELDANLKKAKPLSAQKSSASSSKAEDDGEESDE